MRLPPSFQLSLPSAVPNPIQLLQLPPQQLLRRTLIFYVAHKIYTRWRRRVNSRCRPSDLQRLKAMEEVMRLAPAPDPLAVGGEKIDSLTYCRFLSVNDWDPAKTAAALEKDFKWRMKYKPRSLRPGDMPNMCRQNAWVVLTKPIGRAGQLWGRGRGGGGGLLTDKLGSDGSDGSDGSLSSSGSRGGSLEVASSSNSSSSSGSELSWFGGSRTRDRLRRSVLFRRPLHPPHTRPPLVQWRYTRQGMPITLCTVCEWHPDKCSHSERVKHVAYHMEHYIRRMPTRAGGTRRVQRACFVMDMRGFKPALVRPPRAPHARAHTRTRTRAHSRTRPHPPVCLQAP